MRNTTNEMVWVIFLGPANTTKSIPAGESVEFELPQGTYQVSVWSETTSRRRGTAVFRQRMRYDCTWEIVYTSSASELPPLRLGDPH